MVYLGVRIHFSSSSKGFALFDVYEWYALSIALQVSKSPMVSISLEIFSNSNEPLMLFSSISSGFILLVLQQGSFNSFGKYIIFPLVHIIGNPVTIAEDVSSILHYYQRSTLPQVGIITRAIFTASRIILRLYLLPSVRSLPQTVSLQQDDMSPPSIRSATFSFVL